MLPSFEKTIKENLPRIDLPRRSQIYVGFTCHQKCGFCYYKYKNNEPMFDEKYVERQIDLLADYGIKDIEITGGEPSECKSLRHYCQYIKSRIPDGHIAVITNGGLYNSDVWDLIDEVLVSYHAPKNMKNIDKNMFPMGSVYNKVKKTIDKAKDCGKMVRTNTVLGTFNYKAADQIVTELIDFKPRIINFLPVNTFSEAKEMGEYISYKELRPIIKRSIDRIKQELPDTYIFVRYMPYCEMEGYEQYLVGQLQHMYDWFDWNCELCGDRLFELLKANNTNEMILEELGPYGSLSLTEAIKCRHREYEKSAECVMCKYYFLCDGVEKTKTHRLFSDIIPSKGRAIKNIDHYLNHVTKELYEQIY